MLFERKIQKKFKDKFYFKKLFYICGKIRIMRKVQIKTKDPQLRNFFEIFRSFNLRQMREAVSFLPSIVQEKENETENITWVEDEQYFYGKIIKTGKNVVYLACNNGEIYKIKVTSDELKNIKENPALENCGILASYKQRTDTWEYDPNSFQMLEIIEHNPVYDKENLIKKIKRATPTWRSVDPDNWLKGIRGYED
jgi:hypothetical protein